MREIKFRAWNKIQKKMIKHPEVWNPHPIKVSSIFKTGNKRYEYMQYTGIKDKNNKEIYEGDIIDGRYGKADVRFDEGYCGFVPFAYSSNAPTGEECEVIGNIYENPELLKETKK